MLQVVEQGVVSVLLGTAEAAHSTVLATRLYCHPGCYQRYLALAATPAWERHLLSSRPLHCDVLS